MLLRRLYYVLTIPASIIFLLDSKKIHKSYRMNLFKKLRLGIKMFLNTRRITTGVDFKVHLAMALKLLETPPAVPGDVIECGTWKGGTAANLSLVCRIVGRRLRVYDSFQGLPLGSPGDRMAPHYQPGQYWGELEEVKQHIRKYGALECCDFIQGWFEETLPKLKSSVLLAFVDVDLEASLATCVKHIWPNLANEGYMFIDESWNVQYCALFYSERWWQENFSAPPPGLVGAGTGLGLGDYYVGPWTDLENHPRQRAGSGAYTMKSLSGHWTYYPKDV